METHKLRHVLGFDRNGHRKPVRIQCVKCKFIATNDEYRTHILDYPNDKWWECDLFRGLVREAIEHEGSS